MLAHTRVAELPWPRLEEQLEQQGYALTEPLLTAAECAALAALQGQEGRFRSRIDMARYRFGVGDYGYFAHPLPEGVGELRAALYERLAPLANRWAERLAARHAAVPASRGDTSAGYPETLPEFLALCHARGQVRPTPLLLHYETGGYNCLHQDRYGEVYFPLQATAFLSRPEARRAERNSDGGDCDGGDSGGGDCGTGDSATGDYGTGDYSGGEFLLVENRPRQQSRATALLPGQGQVLIFPSLERPVAGKRGWLRAAMRHGVSTVTSGTRFTLGLIFHDAQ